MHVILKRVGWYDDGDVQREGVSELKTTEAQRLVKRTDKWDAEDVRIGSRARPKMPCGCVKGSLSWARCWGASD